MGVDKDMFPFKWRHYSLHDNKYASYSDKFKGEEYDGIEFHPTYEAKMWRWLKEKDDLDYDDKTAFWIIGSSADTSLIEPFYTEN